MNEQLLKKYESLMLDSNMNPDESVLSTNKEVIPRDKQMRNVNQFFSLMTNQEVILRNEQITEANQIFFKLNNDAGQLEKDNQIKLAIELYELMVKYSTDIPVPYNRLAILYRKQKQYSDEVRVLEKAVYVYENIVFHTRVDRLNKLAKFQERLIKAKELLNKN